MAQFALESGNGAHMPAGSNNPFGIKAKAGQPYVEAQTNEFINGKMERVTQRFAKFDSLSDAFDQHAKLLATASPYAAARTHENDPKAFANALTGVYATDPQYGAKLNAIMARNNAGGGNTSTSDVKIAQINVQTQATDAKGIAKDIGPAVKQYAFTTQANMGLS
jgi:flagellum-specific peptidoglycan hydrolase FlgJ